MILSKDDPVLVHRMSSGPLSSDPHVFASKPYRNALRTSRTRGWGVAEFVEILYSPAAEKSSSRKLKRV
jgi:hypothetical protein